MKNTTLVILATALFCATAMAHERITIGPNGGRVVALDSPAVPNAEFNVRGDSFVITLLDQARRQVAVNGQTLTLIAGDRSKPQKMTAAVTDGAFVAGPKPAGDDYWVILQLRPAPEGKAITFRVHYNAEKCGECAKPEWLCNCGDKTGGKNIKVPGSLDGLFAEINQHHGELKENFAEKKYEALDEVTEAFAVLLKVLPSKSGDKAATAQPQVDSLLADLAAIADANAGRKLAAAAKNIESFNSTLAALKKNFPAKTAGAKP